MRHSVADGSVFAILVALLLLPIVAFFFNGAPDVVFLIGATSFVFVVVLLLWLFAGASMPIAGSSPVVKPFRFTIGDLLCLTTSIAGITIFLLSGFNCEAAERASRPAPLA